jgi:hypothetical protein
MGKKYFYMTQFPFGLKHFFLKLTVKRKHLVVFVVIHIYCCISAVVELALIAFFLYSDISNLDD